MLHTPITPAAAVARPIWASPVLCAQFHRINDAYDRLPDDDDRAAALMAAMDAIEEADAALGRADWLGDPPVALRGRAGL